MLSVLHASIPACLSRVCWPPSHLVWPPTGEPAELLMSAQSAGISTASRPRGSRMDGRIAGIRRRGAPERLEGGQRPAQFAKGTHKKEKVSKETHYSILSAICGTHTSISGNVEDRDRAASRASMCCVA